MAIAALRPLYRTSLPARGDPPVPAHRFAVTMGTGILALALPQIPGAGHALAIAVCDWPKVTRKRSMPFSAH